VGVRSGSRVDARNEHTVAVRARLLSGRGELFRGKSGAVGGTNARWNNEEATGDGSTSATADERAP
jgi:hypothetical protein